MTQVVLVSTQPTAAPASGGVFGFFAPKPAATAPGQPIASLSKLEKQVGKCQQCTCGRGRLCVHGPYA